MAGMFFGVLMSTICETSMEAIRLCIGATLPHMLASGIFWPLRGTVPGWLYTLARLLPHTEAVAGMRDIMLRGWGLHQSPSIGLGLAVTSAWILLYLTLSWLLVRRKL